MAEEVWVEHKVLGGAPRKVTKQEFEKRLGSKGWSLCNPVPRKTVPSFGVSDVEGQRRAELKEAQEAARNTPVFEPGEIRRMELRLKQDQLPSFDPAAERRAELQANNLERVLEDLVVEAEAVDLEEEVEIIFEPDPELLSGEELDE